ncbi:MAG: hypothetical protein IT521_14995 [Burkholderiales bacterium]|nr:hypothetical protein [Burkholderiales bacterium]
MGYALANLLRNLGTGLRLACFLPVQRLAFRIDLTQLLLLFAVSAGIDVAGEGFLVEAPREFSWLGAGTELYAAGLLLLSSALIALANRQRQVALALPVIVLAAIPVIQGVQYLAASTAAAAGDSWSDAALLAGNAAITWMVLVLVRCVAVAFSPLPGYAWLRAIAGGLLLAAPIWLGDVVTTTDYWWHAQSGADTVESDMNAGSETVQAAQTYLLDSALENLLDQRSGQTDLYYVGFAPYARQDAYRTDAEAAQAVMNSHWGTTDRSLLLVNNPRTLVTTPFATVTNLREVLNEIGAIIDPEEDVVMVYLASRDAAEGRLSAYQPPLSLVELTPAGLKYLLDDAEIKWRIIVVSACYSGEFIEALADDYTLIVTDADVGHISFACEGRTPPTFFGDAFFVQGLGRSASFEAAFDRAKSQVAQRERDAGYAPPSSPQIFVGDEMAKKLKSLRERGTGGVTVQGGAAPVHG